MKNLESPLPVEISHFKFINKLLKPLQGRFLPVYGVLSAPFIYSASQTSESGLIEPTNFSIFCFCIFPFISLYTAPNIGTIGTDLSAIWRTATANYFTGRHYVSKTKAKTNISHSLFQLKKLKIILQSIDILRPGL